MSTVEIRLTRVVLLASFVLIGAFGAVGCEETAGGPEPEGGQLLESGQQRITTPDLEEGELDELVEGNTAFAFDLYQVLAGREEGNLFYSPYSISLALAMTYAGAEGNTEAEMAEALHFTLDESRLHNAFNALDLTLTSRGQDIADGFRLHIVNAIWGQRGYDFLESFLDVLALNYGAGLRILDFMSAPDEARKTINDWVAYETEDKIEDLLPEGSITSDTRLVLTNAIYFYGDWLYQFEKSDTWDQDFHLIDGGTVRPPTMHAVNDLRYASGESYQAVELPYVGEELSMLVVLPAEGMLDDLEAELGPALLDEIDSGLAETRVELALPKFEFDAETDLVDPLMSLGMVDAFGAADFSGINGRYDLFISGVFHKAYVRVDEEGTEAAAATAVVVGETSAPVGDVQMTVDRPFLFAIRDNATGTVLFVGRVMNPAE